MMVKEETPKCSICGAKLSTHEINDNIYAGIAKNLYVCYACQNDVDVDDDIDDEVSPASFEDDDF